MNNGSLRNSVGEIAFWLQMSILRPDHHLNSVMKTIPFSLPNLHLGSFHPPGNDGKRSPALSPFLAASLGCRQDFYIRSQWNLVVVRQRVENSSRCLVS
jgi:hypothetical protein